MTLWGLLGVKADCTLEELKGGWRRFAKTHHPDVNGGDEGKTRLYVSAKNVYEKALKAKEKPVAPVQEFNADWFTKGSPITVTVTVNGQNFTIVTGYF